MSSFREKEAFIWSITDPLLRGVFKRNEYQKVILPFTVLKRFDSVLEYSKQDVLDRYDELRENNVSNIDTPLKNVAVDKDGNRLGFYNHSRYDFKKLLEDPDNIEANLYHYLDSFSEDVQDIFIRFNIKHYIKILAEKDRLYLIVSTFSESSVDLSPEAVSNHEMGTIFEELIRKFSEQSNEEAGEHFTPRDVIKLMNELMFIGEDFSQRGLIKLIYDPTCGTGGMLTSCKDYILERNTNTDVVLFGQELNDEIYAICKSDILMKGDNANNIKGPSSTLSDDQLRGKHFDYILANPPYGVDWGADKEYVENEAQLGFDGRFGAGLPRKNDGQLLFIQHMISKMYPNKKSRIVVITDGSPLSTGDAGSGESDIRKWIFECDYLEALVALPDQLFFNTGINTYVWILTNEKSEERKGKVQLIDARDEFINMRKSLGNKRHEISDESIENIISLYNSFEESDKVKIFDNEDFGYTKITVERPMQLNYNVTEESIEHLHSVSQFKKLAESNAQDPEIKEEEIAQGKLLQSNIKDALRTIPEKIYTNWDEFESQIKEVLDNFDLSSTFRKNIILNFSEHDDNADYVKDNRGKVKADPNLRDNEKIPLKKDINEYFEEEVLKYYPDAWIDDSKDKEGYKINFAQYFYIYEPPRPLEEIEADIKKVTADIQELLKE